MAADVPPVDNHIVLLGAVDGEDQAIRPGGDGGADALAVLPVDADRLVQVDDPDVVALDKVEVDPGGDAGRGV